MEGWVLIGEIGVEGWVAIITAIGGAVAVPIVGLICSNWLKVREKDNEIKMKQLALEEKKAELASKQQKDDNAAEKRNRKELVEEQEEVITELGQELRETRGELHQVRNACNNLQLAVSLCEYDRNNLRRQIQVMADTLGKHGITVAFPIDPPMPPTMPAQIASVASSQFQQKGGKHDNNQPTNQGGDQSAQGGLTAPSSSSPGGGVDPTKGAATKK